MLLLFWGASALSTATPSITLSLTPATLAIKRAQASPGITLSMSNAVRLTLAAAATPSIRLEIAARAVGGFDDAGNSVVELEYNASGSTITGSQVITFREGGVSTLTLSQRE